MGCCTKATVDGGEVANEGKQKEWERLKSRTVHGKTESL
jgi:hypothetical protein